MARVQWEGIAALWSSFGSISGYESSAFIVHRGGDNLWKGGSCVYVWCLSEAVVGQVISLCYDDQAIKVLKW